MRPQGAGDRAFTLAELIVMIVIATVIALIFLFALTRRPRETVGPPRCPSNMMQIGAAIIMYRQSNGGFYPFAEGPAGSADSEYRADLSLALLYPAYLDSARVFRCMATEDMPEITLSKDGPVLKGSGFGYDCRVSPSAVAGHVIVGDMDGSYFVNQKTKTQNHKGGQYVLYVDGHVSYRTTNFASNNAFDNIFTEDPWNADTDSYLVWPSKALGVSYDGYPELQQTIETTDKH